MKKVIFMLMVALGVIFNSCSSETNSVEKSCCGSVCSVCDTTVNVVVDSVKVDSLVVDSVIVDTISK